MHRRLSLISAVFAVAGMMSQASAASAAPPTAKAAPRIVCEFVPGDGGSFAESLVLGARGDLFASVTDWMPDGVADVGRIWRIHAGALQRFGPELDAGGGLLTGLATDDEGNLYVGDATFGYDTAPGVFRIDPAGSLTRVLTLPDWTFPNGLTFHAGYLYVSDSTGAIWRTRPGVGGEVQSTPWLADPSLAPSVGWEGVNGITFAGNTLYAVNADTGTVLRLPLLGDGAPGPISTLISDPALVTADGIALDPDGTLWIAVNHESGGALATVDRHGTLRVVANDPTWLDYPSQPVFGPGRSPILYVENGSLANGTPDVIALDPRSLR